MRGRNPFDGKPQMTLRDVAEAAGVSEMTVSRVLRNRGDVSTQTRDRVHAAARKLGYVPNKIAGALASNRVNLVGVVIPSLSNMVFPDVLAGIGEVLDETPLQPVIGTSKYDDDLEEKVIYEMLSWRPSGLIVAGLEHSQAARAMMANAGIPVVEVMDVDGDPVAACVGISQHEAGRQMAHEIAKRGYRRIGYCGSSSSADHRAQKRRQGFIAGLSEMGLQLADTCLYAGTSGFGTGRAMAAEIMTRSPDSISFTSTVTSTQPVACFIVWNRGWISRAGSAWQGSTASKCSMACPCGSPRWTANATRSGEGRPS